MITLITGKEKSGKSEVAENMLCEESIPDGRRYYIAAMKVLDDAGKKRIEKHRKMRSGKGFVTIEAPVRVSETRALMEDMEKASVLLECIPNLVGNMMHESPWQDMIKSDAETGNEEFTDEVICDVINLSKGPARLYIVTNEYETTGGYDMETELYIKLIGLVNSRLEKLAQRVVRI